MVICDVAFRILYARPCALGRKRFIVGPLSTKADFTRGKEIKEFVSAIDIIPTFIEWLNGDIPEEVLEGESLLPLLHNKKTTKQQYILTELDYSFRKQREDFVVWVPQLVGKPSESWIDNTKVPKHEYYQRLQNCKVGVQMRQTNYGWSVSGTDCMMNGTPMIFQDSLCYREIDPNGLFFKKKTEFFDLLDKMLDDDIFRFTHELRSLERAKELSTNEGKMIKELHKQLNT